MVHDNLEMAVFQGTKNYNYYKFWKSFSCTLDYSHRIAPSEVVQAIKSVKEIVQDCI